MRLMSTLPIVAGLSVAGAALGLHLGRSAIAEINPAYFTDPEVPFHADLSPYRSPDWAQVQAAEYHQPAIVGEGFGGGCIGCVAAPVVYSPQGVLHVQAWQPESAYAVEAQPQAVEAEAAPEPELERVRRYASYPLTAEEGQAAAGAAEGEAALAYAPTE
jgi:hypothetical protein